MSDVLGTWNLSIATPIGVQEVVVEIWEEAGALQGHATREQDVSRLESIEVSGAHVRWSQRVRRPLRLTLQFELEVAGDTLTGVAKAGVFPTSQVTGTRAR